MEDEKLNNTNPDLFLLILQTSVKRYLEIVLSISKEHIELGFGEIRIDFYVGSAGDIDLNKVCISMCGEGYSGIMFEIDNLGNYKNSCLSEQDLELVLNLTKNMLIKNSNPPKYDISKKYNQKSLKEQLADAVISEDFETAENIKNILN